MDDKKFFYIYNLEQANFFINNNIPIIKVGKGKDGDFYVKFPRNNHSEEVFTLWCNRSRIINKNY